MKLSWRWIKEFIQTDLSAENAADRLTHAGVEVTAVTPRAPTMHGIVVGRVETVERDLGEHGGHRNLLVRVSTGREHFRVICGAPNCAPGVRAAFAPPGAVLPGPRPIGVAVIRGTASEGMLCSERELGLGDEHEAGILVVDADAPLGADLGDYLMLDDSILEVDVTPDRPDCLSVVGIARELSALTGAQFAYPTIAVKEADEDVQTLARVEIAAPELCPRYAARVITGVRVGPSPGWLAFRLRAVGLRPISGVVDVTNYVLWELGHPLHAFDYDTVAGHHVIVRTARANERVTTLDGQERRPNPGMLLITDPEHAIAIAGVMGGASTEVTAATTRVLLESAYFQPASIRRTARELGLRTDAAYRFERGADIEGLRDALDRAAQMTTDLAGGVVARGVLDAYPRPRSRPRIRLRMSRLRRLIGDSPPTPEAAAILEGLGLLVTRREGRSPPAERQAETLDVEVPFFRRDLSMEDDLVEEVARVWGYDRIPSTLPPPSPDPVTRPLSLEQADRVREALVGAGLHEVVTGSLEDPAAEATVGDPESAVRLLNPLSQDASILRTNLLPGLLRVIATNVRRQQPDVRIFEIGKHYQGGQAGPEEARWLGIALTGARSDPAWYAGRESVDVYDAKGLAELVLGALDVQAASVETSALPTCFEDGRAGWLTAGGRRLAVFGEVARSARAAFEIPAPVFAALIALDTIGGIVGPAFGARADVRASARADVPASIRAGVEASAMAVPRATPTYAPLPKYPSVQRDVAFLVPLDLPAADVEAVLREHGGPCLARVVLFDVYTGGQIEPGLRSIAWRLTFQANDRTLTDEEANQMSDAAVAAVRHRFGIEARRT
jgi:phenylalanyl-tRNA synthetase beta chain